jgi:tryptophan-rich sensory protein
MSVNPHFEHIQARSIAERVPLWAVIFTCVAIDLAVVWYIARMWDRLVPYLPYLLLGIALISFVARLRKVLRRDG